MKIGWKSLGLAILIALSLSPAVATPAYAANSTGDVVNQINAIRVQNGLAPLVAQSQLTASAQSYATAMATGKFFGHVAPNGSTLVTRNEGAGYAKWTYLEENLAAGQTSVAAAVNAWMQSPSHRADLLSPRVTETGVGYVYVAGSPYGHYWVQEFGSRSIPAEKAPVVVAKAPAVSAAPVAAQKAAAPAPTPKAAAPVAKPVAKVLAAVQSSPASTPVIIAETPKTMAAILATEEPRPVVARAQRDPDNLNLYLIVYRTLGVN
jgi:hypothetical protein